MTTYTVAANNLEGVIVRFQVHPNPAFLFLHHTLNSVYGVDLYETDFYFLFDDVTTNGQTELHKDASKRLLDYMITHILTESGATTRGETEKVEKLFKTMLLSYKMSNGKHSYFKRGQDLALAIIYSLQNKRQDVPEKCLEVQFSLSRIYPSLIGIVDGLNMNKLFSSEQAITALTMTATVTAGNHLATIANTMSTAVSGVTSRAAANHADADKDETIDFKDMPADVRARYNLKNHPINVITKSDLKPYHNKLTVDKHGARQSWSTVKYLALGLGNTTKHKDQTYLITNDGSLFRHLDHQSTKNKAAFVTGASDIDDWTPKRFFNFCITMEKAGAINRVWIFPYLCRRQDGPSKWGFVCADQNADADADLPYKYQSKINGWGVQIMQYLKKFLLKKEAHDILRQCGTDGHIALQLLHLKFNQIHFRYQTDQCKTVPVQGNQSINAYIRNYNWHVPNRALILDQANDIGNVHTQDMFISNMKRCDDVRSIVVIKRTSPDQ